MTRGGDGAGRGGVDACGPLAHTGRMPRRRLARSLLLAALVALVTGVAAPAAAQSPAFPLPPKHVTRAEFARLRWIVGTWRGTGVGQAPFYERYRLADDSTLLVETFADSTLARVTETARYELRAGELGDGDERWAAVAIDARSVWFAPVPGGHARNDFTWQRRGPDAWVADLRWPADASRAERTRTYYFTRWAPPAAR